MAPSAPLATATTASATWRSRWRFDRHWAARRSAALLWAALVLAVGPSGCDDEGPSPRDAVAEIQTASGPLVLERGVVEAIAAREGISEAQAEAQALDTLRYVAARRDEIAARSTPPETPDDLPESRRNGLERGALARLWLDREFEPQHRPEHIPARTIAANMADVRVTQRLFHPEVWVVCQALIVPTEQLAGRNAPVPGSALAAKVGDPEHPEAPPVERDPQREAAWHAAATEVFAPVVRRILDLREPITDDCELFGRLMGGTRPRHDSEVGGLTVRFERFAFAPSEVEGFDQTWLDAVVGPGEEGFVGPFTTDFGEHLVLVSAIQEAQLADGSLPPAELQAAREAKLREEIVERWRVDEFHATLEAIRERRVVRLAADLERSP